MGNVVQFPAFTEYGPKNPDERQRLARMFAGKTLQDMRDLWDSFDEETSFCGPYDCVDVHSYLNMLGDGRYCAV